MTDETVMAYAAVRCRGDVAAHSCGLVEIDEQEYSRQMSRPDSLWCCPNCGSTAYFDDEYFEKSHGIDQEEDDTPPLEVALVDLVRVYGTDDIRRALDKFEEDARRGG